MANSPRRAKKRGSTSPPRSTSRGDRSDRGEVIRVGCVAHAQCEPKDKSRKKSHAEFGRVRAFAERAARGWRQDTCASSSTPMPRPSAPARRLWAALFLLSSPAVVSARPFLHTALRRSEPSKEAELATPPTRIALWFTAKPQLPFSRILLIGPAGAVSLDRLVADTGNGLYARITSAVGPGRYTVQWQAGSADGHPIRGEFGFVVLADPSLPATVASDPVAVEPPPLQSGTLDRSEYRTARWIEFVALLTVLGALGFRHGVLPPLAARGVPTADAADRARRLGQSALVLYTIAALVRLYTVSRAMNGPASALAPSTLLPLITRSMWGLGWLAGVVGAILLFLGWTISRKSVTVGTPLALTGALGMVLSPAMSGHATGSEHFVISVTLDMLHVAAAGVWAGGLLIVLFAGIPAMRRLTDGNPDAATSALVNSFHPIALFCAPLVVAAGLGTGWLRLGGLDALLGTEYGRILVWKVMLVLVVISLGAYNAMRARRRLGTPAGTRSFRFSAAAEILFAAAVLAVTAALVVTPVPNQPPTP
jgi:copper transport protein